MSKVQESWKKWKPALIVTGAALFVIAVIVVIIGLIMGPGEKSPESGGTHTGSSSQPSREGVTDEPEDGGKAELAPAPKLGDDGLVSMEVTTDPRVAAASAAQVLMSADTTKVQWVDDFRKESLNRVMRPSPDYVGPGSAIQVKEFGGDTLTGDDLIERAPQMLATEKYSPTGWWWLLGDTQSFGGYSSYGATLVSRAIEVYDQEEMSAYSGGAFWTVPSDATTINLPEGASFELYWVRVETTTTTGDGATTLRYPTALAVYCDPPSDGGLCGVTGLMTRYPDGWKTSY